MSTLLKIILYLSISSICLGQFSILENSSFKIDKQQNSVFSLKDTIDFIKAHEEIVLPKFSTVRLKFSLNSFSSQDSILYIRFEGQGSVKLYGIYGSNTKLMGETGFICPYYKRSIRDEIAFIKVNLQTNKTNDYILEAKNYNIKHDKLSFQMYNYAQYQEIKIRQKDRFINKFGQPIFLGVVVLILLITGIQCVIFREKVYFFYLFFIIFVLLRVAMNISLLIVEDFIPALRQVGFISRYSQSFSFLSIIAYLFFIREFANTRNKKPIFDTFLKFQILYIGFYLIAELFFVVEKYTVPQFITIHSIFELLETTLSMVTIIGLISLYNKQNKYLIFGVVFFFLVAFVGQQILLMVSKLSRLEQDIYLQFLWGIAYLGEMIFFTLALFSRAAFMKQTIEIQTVENQKLMQRLEKIGIKDSSIQPETLNIATSRGTIIIQQTDIFRVEASGNYTMFYVSNQKQVMASNTMAEFEDKLNANNFIRVHKSHIINLKFVVKYTKGDGGSLTLEDGSEIPVSRSRKEELLKKLFNE